MEKEKAIALLKIISDCYEHTVRILPDCPERVQACLKLTEAGMWIKMAHDMSVEAQPVISKIHVKEKNKM